MKTFKISTALFAMLLLGLTVFAGEEKKDEGTQTPANPAAPAASEIKWLSYDEGLAKAKKEGKHLFVDFTAKWCGYCKKMDGSTFVEPEIVKMLNNDFVPVKVDGDSEKELNIEGYKVTEKNLSRQEYKVRGYPTFWFLDAQGTKLGAVSGYQPATNLLNTLQYVKDKKYAEEQKTDEKKEEPKKN
ncbi:MAG TPA: thioredoxin fold domain-containing protein [candidate division Zixibacteria bacterium]|nr:thioredoxin fold domain-containing protein [candidate division Zixibacteria bacterium]